MKRFITFVSIIIASLVLLFAVHHKGDDFKVIRHLQEISVNVDTSKGEGSGTVFTHGDESYVLTAAHVILDDETKKVTTLPITVKQFDIHNNDTNKESSYVVEVLKYSEKNDIALLHVKKKRAFVSEGDVYNLAKYPEQGTVLYHVGCLFGKDGYNSFTTGVISQYGREVLGHTLVQTTCPIYPGSSGGGVFLTDGRYVGMALAARADNINYYAPIQNIRTWLKEVGYEFILD